MNREISKRQELLLTNQTKAGAKTKAPNSWQSFDSGNPFTTSKKDSLDVICSILDSDDHD